MAPIIIFHREKESNGFISTLLPTSNVGVDLGEQIFTVTTDISNQDDYWYQPQSFGRVILVGLMTHICEKAFDFAKGLCCTFE